MIKMIKKSRITDEEIAILDCIALEISNAGHQINALHNCRNGQKTYKYAIPILLKHINKNYSTAIKEDIAQAFAHKDAYVDAFKELLKIYLNHTNTTPSKRYIDIIAWSLSEMFTKNDIHIITNIIKNKKLGTSRLFFIIRLLRFKFDEKHEIIDFMLSDPDLYKETQHRLKIKKARH